MRLKDVQFLSTWTDKKSKIKYTIQDYDSLVDWFGEHYTEFDCKLFYVSDKSSEGYQFVHGFTGVGGLLKYKVAIEESNYEQEDDYDMEDFI